MVGGNDLKLIRREPNADLRGKIARGVSDFWESVDGDEPPEVTEADADAVIAMCQKVSPETLAPRGSVKEENVLDYNAVSKEISDLNKKKKYLKAIVLQEMGDNELALDLKWKVSASMTKETVVEKYIRKAFRNFRVTVKK